MASGHGRLRALAGTVVLGLTLASPLAAQESARFAHLSVDDGLSQSSVQHILQDRRGLMWFGTQEGLNRCDGYRFTVHRAREQDGFLRDHDITAMVEDAAGDLWVGTSRGLYRRCSARSTRSRRSGSDPTAAVFSVEMAPLHYVDPSSNRLMYRLEGFDPQWVETGAHNRVATYTNLAPGRYVLRARAGTKNGLWSQQDATLAIRILPPWWRTGPALAGWALLAVAALALAVAAVRRRASVHLALQEREALRRDSLTDPLTGLYNRRFLTTYLQHEVPRVVREYRVRGAAAAESGDDLLLLIVDVDHVKSINDRHSHGVGDRVLAGIAATLEEQIRDSDLAVRWGGDEFLVVTRSFRRASAADCAERLRAAVASLGRTLAADGGPACTVSIGFAAFPFIPHEPDALTWEQTLELADSALRLTKDRKRDAYTGLRATAGVSAAAVLEFLTRADAPLPAGVEVVTPGDLDSHG